MLAIFFIAFTFIDYGEAKGQLSPIACPPGQTMVNLPPATDPSTGCIYTIVACYNCTLTGSGVVNVDKYYYTYSGSCTFPNINFIVETIQKQYAVSCSAPPCPFPILVNVDVPACWRWRNFTYIDEFDEEKHLALLLVPDGCDTDAYCRSSSFMCMDNSQSPPIMQLTPIPPTYYGTPDCSSTFLPKPTTPPYPYTSWDQAWETDCFQIETPCD